MGDRSKIEWCDASWNPVTGCTKVSQGCKHCYAERMGKRFPEVYPEGFKVHLRPERLEIPIRWTKPRRIFVCSMSDLFHEDVPSSFLCEVFAVMAAASSHTFQILTKRPERMREWLTTGPDPKWPFPNVWLGVSVEDQAAADERIPILLDTPAAMRFVSCEPLLGPVDLTDLISESGPGFEQHSDVLYCDVDPEDDSRWHGATLDWVIAGGESGPGARPSHPDWFRGLRDQCQSAGAGVPFFFKQWGEWRAREVRGPCDWGDLHPMAFDRVGKKAAGRELDGRTWDEMPREKHRVNRGRTWGGTLNTGDPQHGRGVMKRIAELTQMLGTWARATFPSQTHESIVAHLESEARELVDAVETGGDVEEEIADVVILALVLAHELGVDVDAAICAKYAVNRGRTWGEPNDRGFIEHVRAERGGDS